ncbi:Dihydroprymidine dehydrogenase domain II, 4Fe-4S cluster [Desulfocicer vacuolatum DSM 3385]|uniref:dihydrouracil dehydrogenase (NAD(+)) n=1 Tax=Desulfocicer vacuolatum DSM 3385 TaxID=1121400 RepID=A0A1W2CSF5_9BACT|nr:hypothetical protein [Desulfocicer vacuolatum]SMC88169.1 Dihydroprymidine dehydrogenase domain II, 4Fe-4S cluster [Desulfocicer vacuolatum DSM 3385]
MLDAVYDEPSMSTTKRYNLHAVKTIVQHSVAPCSAACPAGIDIPKVQHHVCQGEFLSAFETLTLENPFPSTCGRICFHSCETACHRTVQDDAIAIHCMERFVGDLALNREFLPSIKKLPLNGKRVAILGTGPSGLSAAYFLTIFGFSCDVYDSAPSPAHSSQWCIPESRLPKTILNMEINRIREMGVKIKCGHSLSPDFANALVSQYHAVVVGSGISQSMTFSQCLGNGNTTLHGALQTRKHPRRIELGNVTVELGKIPVLYGGGWYNGIQSISHAVASGKTAAISLYAYFDTGSSAIRESVEISRVGNGTAQSMDIYLLGERSRASSCVVAESDIDCTGFPSAVRVDPLYVESGFVDDGKKMMEQTFDTPSALAEAARCYGCGYTTHGKKQC